MSKQADPSGGFAGAAQAPPSYDEVLAALERIAACPDMNLEGLEEESVEALDQARSMLARAGRV